MVQFVIPNTQDAYTKYLYNCFTQNLHNFPLKRFFFHLLFFFWQDMHAHTTCYVTHKKQKIVHLVQCIASVRGGVRLNARASILPRVCGAIGRLLYVPVRLYRCSVSAWQLYHLPGSLSRLA